MDDKVMKQTLPLPIAAFWNAVLQEPHALVRLYWLKDLYELVLRWCVAISLGYHRALNDGDLPIDLRNELGSILERPTLGQWRYIFFKLLEAGPSNHLGFMTLRVVQDRINEASPQGETYQHSLIALRNLLAHGGGLSPTDAELLLSIHLPKTKAIIEAIIDVPCIVVGLGPEGYPLLAGSLTKSLQLIKPNFDNDSRDTSWLLTEQGPIGLAPFVHYRPPSYLSGDGKLQEIDQAPCSQIFMRKDRKQQVFTPINGQKPIVHDLDTQLLKRRFGRIKDQQSEEEVIAKDSTFLEEAFEQSQLQVGRLAEMDTLQTWVKNQTSWQEQRRLAWIKAGPGLGKSMLMCSVTTWIHDHFKLSSGGAGKLLLYIHRFRAGDTRNSSRAFFQGLLKACQTWTPTKKLFSDEDCSSSEIVNQWALIEKLQAHLSSKRPTHPEAIKSNALNKSKTMIYILADGLDEIAQHDHEFAHYLVKLPSHCITIMAAGRSDYGLDELMQKSEADRPLPNGLEPMSPLDIRAMLVLGLGNQRGQLIAKDQWVGDQVSNSFIDGVVQRAQGLPIYVNLVLQDLHNEVLTVDHEDRLPQSLSAYYQELVSRLGLKTVQRDLPLLITALSTAEESLTDEALASLMALPWEEDSPIYLNRVEAALRVGDSLLRYAPNADGELGSTIYHQSFREFIIGRLGDDGKLLTQPCLALSDTLDEVRKRLWRAALHHPILQANPLGRHLHRWGTEYLLWWAPDGMSLAAQRLLDLPLTLERLQYADLNEINDWIQEFTLIQLEGSHPLSADFKAWAHFVKTRAAALRRPLHNDSYLERFVQLALEHADSSPLTNNLESLGEYQPAIRSLNRPTALHTQTLLNVIDFGGNGSRLSHHNLFIDDGLMIICTQKTLVYQIATGQLLQAFDLRGPKLVAPRRLLLNHEELWNLETLTCLSNRNFTDFNGEAFGFPHTLVCFEEYRIVFIHLDDGQEVHEIPGQFIVRKELFKTTQFVLLAQNNGQFSVWNIAQQKCLGTLEDKKLSAKQLVEVQDHSSGGLRVVSGSGTKGAHLGVFDLSTFTLINVVSLPARCKVYAHQDRLICVEQYSKRKVHFIGIYRESNLSLINEYGVSTAQFKVNQHTEKYDFNVLEHSEYVMVNDSRSVTLVSGDLHSHWALPSDVVKPKRDLYLHQSRALVVCQNHLFYIDLVSHETLVFDRFNDISIVQTETWVDFYGSQHHSFNFEQQILHSNPIVGLSGSRVHRLGDQLIAFDQNKSICFWQSGDSEVTQVSDQIHKAVPKFKSLSEQWVMSYASDGYLALWNLNLRSLEWSNKAHQQVLGIHHLPKHQRVISWGNDLKVQLWDLANGQCLNSTEGAGCDLSQYEEFPALHHGQLLSLSEDGIPRVWEANGDPRTILRGMTPGHLKYVDLQDQSILTWGYLNSKDTRIFHWSLEPNVDGGDKEDDQGHQGQVLGAIHHDQHFYTWAEDQWVIAWSHSTGQVFKQYRGLSAPDLPATAKRLIEDKQRQIDAVVKYESSVKDQPYPYEGYHRSDYSYQPYSKLALAEGLVLSNLRKETFLIWNMGTQEVIFEGTPQQLINEHTQCFTTLERSRWLNCLPNHPHVHGQTVAIAHRNGLSLKTESGRVLEWHALAQPTLHLLDDKRALLSFGAEVNIIAFD
jgi:hypothetical protein